MKLVTIVALAVDTQNAVLYHADGTTTCIPQGDARLPEIVRIAKDQLPFHKKAVVDIEPVVPRREEFEEAEKGTGGLIKFFRVARHKLKEFLNMESPVAVPKEVAHISPLELGKIPTADVVEDQPVGIQQEVYTSAEGSQSAQDAEPPKPVELTNDQKVEAAHARMRALTEAAPTTEDPAFHVKLDEAKESIVAVNTKTGTVIPDAHKLAPQLRAATKLQDFTGFTRFVERLELIIKDRGHSVEDLMKFIEKGDLPIADDGCIVIYKRLNTVSKGVFKDCHTGKVIQKVGSYVFMREGLVDPDRRQSCSNGLHVATLNYISGFNGNVTIIGKVRPEDVFAVPEYDVTKMRVCGYHIIAELPDSLRDHVNSGKSISDLPEGKKLLNDVLRGNHIGVTQHVEIGGNRGSNLTITDVDPATAGFYDPVYVPVDKPEAETIDLNQSFEPEVPTAAPIAAQDLKEPEPIKQSAPKADRNKYQDKMDAILEAIVNDNPAEARKVARELEVMKKVAKKGWGKLGITPDEEATYLKALSWVPKAKGSASVATATAKPEVKMSNKDRAAELWQFFLKAKESGVRADIIDAANELQFFLKSTKKGAAAHGLPGVKVKEALKTWATSK